MDIKKAIVIFDALSQETRLSAFRLLVKAGSAGLAAGELSKKLKVPHNTLSFHLSHLLNAKVVGSNKVGRSVVYSANFEVVQKLISFMAKDCCSADFVKIEEDKAKGCSIIKLRNCC